MTTDNNTFRFTDTRLKNLTNDTGKPRIDFKDTIQSCLQLRVSKTGSKTFRARIWDSNKKKLVQSVIGSYPKITIEDARIIVATKISEFARGIDAQEIERKKKAELTFHDAFHKWLELYSKQNNKGWKEDLNKYHRYLEKYFSRKLMCDITEDDILTWRATLLKQKKERGDGTLSKGTVNRSFEHISTVFNKITPHLQNPCKNVKKFEDNSRDRYLKPEEVDDFFTALESDDTPEWLRDYVLVSLYTGARRGNVLSMTFSELDLNFGIWGIPKEKMKVKKLVTIPLLDDVVEILKRRQKVAKTDFVFPSPRTSKLGHITEPKRGWYNLIKRANIKERFTLHDLRRTIGSYQAITGSSTKLIGASLGNSTEKSVAVYARLHLAPVKNSLNNAKRAIELVRENPENINEIFEK